MCIDNMLYKISFVLLIVFWAGEAKHEEYKKYRVYTIKLKSPEQQQQLHRLKIENSDFWRNPLFDHDVEGRVMVHSSQFDQFEDILKEIGIDKRVEIEDVFEHLKEKDKHLRKTLSRESVQFNFEAYYRYNTILEHLREMQEIFMNSSTNINLIEFGKTEENRPVFYLKLSRNGTENKPTIIIEGGINPREWITIPAAVKIAEKVVENDVLDEFDWIIIPVLNPDGYEYTHTNLRLWSKSMSLKSHLGFICPGVNLNRNFDINWMISDSSSSPCSHLYGGIEPFSEVETQMVKSLIEEYGSRLKMYISLQNKDGFVSYPWQFEKAASGMFRKHHSIGFEMINASKYDYKLDIASVASGERRSGTSGDYARQNDVLYTYNIGIVGRGDDFVFIPEDEIEDIVEDVWAMVSTAAKLIT